MNRILAADIGGTKTKIGICCILAGSIESYKEYDTDSHLGGPAVIKKLISQLSEYDGYEAIAISTAGQVNVDEGYIIYANENIPQYTGMRLKEILEDTFHFPVRVENDVNAAALGEANYGAGKDVEHFLCLTYGTGIGGAIVIDGKIYRGASGSAAEFGHIFTHSMDEVQKGNRLPYYECYAATSVLVSSAQQVNPNWSNGKIIYELWEQGDEAIVHIVERWTDEVASGLASLIHIFNPPLIVLGGGIMEREAIITLIEHKSKQLVMSSFANVQIIPATLGNRAGLLGAASLYLPM
ncbi:ROK family protein [Paenibacillus endoradicis]|uniref:ROK family protein n=1 Tax=Paenibacillus endoradicis TaxID=2972487 RepID=UPI0021591A55|nr:ROK family protein [Paenibacillus endoradicis]MCR8660221.1 ROK family protein [Paenibacillus endoradicis]